MSNDEHGETRRDGFRSRAPGHMDERRQRGAPRPAPGKVTLTSRLSAEREPALQRRAATGTPATPGARSGAAPSAGAAPTAAPGAAVAPGAASGTGARAPGARTADAWMDAAHRGAAALSGHVPGASVMQMEHAGHVPGASAVQMEHAGRAPARGARVSDGVSGDSASERARAIHEAFHGALFSEDEEQALAQLRGQSVAAIRRVRSAYQARYGARLEDEFAAYCDDEQAAEALALLWPAMPVIDRLLGNTSLLDDNEDAMLDVLRTATRGELADAAADPRLPGLLDELSDDQQYQARRLIWPERTREHVLWRIARAHGALDDDEDAVYDALLDLGPGERRALWEARAQHLAFLSESELALVRRMCVGEDGGVATEAAALDARMHLATAGLGTDDDAVRLVAGRVASLAEEETRLSAALDAGVTPAGEPLSPAQRAAISGRLSEIGGVHARLLGARRDRDGALAGDSFLGRLHDDVGAEEYAALARDMGGDAYERAKQQLLDATGVLNDDEDAVYRAFRALRAPLALPPGHAATDYPPDELRRMQEQADAALRARLRRDPDLAPVWRALDQDERAVLEVHVSGDGYRIALHELEQAYRGLDTDEARIVRIVAGMSAADRARMLAEQPPIYRSLMTGLDAAEAALVRGVLRTGRVPAERALDLAMGGFGDGTDEALLLDALGSMSDEERRAYRLGYWLHAQAGAAGDAQGEALHALLRFRALHARLRAELDDEELDAAMERLIGLPTPEDFLAPEGRRMAVEIMAHRQRERMALSGGLTEALTSTDETAAQSAMIYEAHLAQLRARGGDVSLEDFAVLVGLDAQFRGRFDEYRATVELWSDLAGTVAATVAAVVMVVLSNGALAPAAAKLIASSGGAALWSAVAGAGAHVAASEAFGGDFHQSASTEGARNALVGAIEGAVAVASAALAARAVGFVGLRGNALGGEIARAAMESAESGLALSGRGLARGALEGAIDGFVSGAAGELVMTATDVDTWRRSVWSTLGDLGLSLLRGGAFGAAGGALAGGAMDGLGALRTRTGGLATRTGGLEVAGRRRAPEEHAALAAELPPELRGVVDIVESDAVQGAGVHVVYKDGALRIEVGPEAEPRHVRYHAGAARHLLKYQGPLGHIRRLLDAILTKLRLTPGYGTRGFEARQEVKKLLEIQAELQALRARLDGRVRTLAVDGDPSRLDPRQLDRELAEIQEQLEYHQSFIDSYEPGRGFVAAEGAGRSLPELAVARRDLFEVVSEEGSLWAVTFYAKAHDGTELWLGKGSVTLDKEGIPKSYPSFTLDATTDHLGKDHAIHIYDDTSVQAGDAPRGLGQRHSATAHAIGRMLGLYTRRFGHAPEALEGLLAWTNKKNFQREYYQLKDLEGMDPNIAAVAAIKRISFGQHRKAYGYNKFEVQLTGTESVDLGPPYGRQRVPKRIFVIARRDR